jgi:subtilisin family serine protease
LRGDEFKGAAMRNRAEKLHRVGGAALAVLLLTALCVGGSGPAAAQFAGVRVPPVHIVPRIGGNLPIRVLPRNGVSNGVIGTGRVQIPHPHTRVVTRPFVGEPVTSCGGGHYRYGSCIERRYGGTGVIGHQQVFAARHFRGDNGNSGGNANNSGGLPLASERRFVPDEVIVVFSANASPQAIRRLTRRYNLTQLESRNFALIGTTLSRWRISGRRSVPSVVEALQNQNIVTSAQPNYVFALQQDTGQTAAAAKSDSAQYVLAKLQIEQAQQIATGAHVLVAVIDSEIDAKNPDLGGSVVKSFDALSGADQPQLHGTEMAGAIASHGKLLGIAPGAELLAARAFDDQSNGTSFAVYKSLQWAADNGARIVNMSFAGPEDPILHRMLAAVAAKDILLVAAAGNAGPFSAPLYPAADPSVIAVTATDDHDHLFNMTNRGPYIALAAPGVDILALAPDDSFELTTGTSVAAAHVSGAAALLLQHDPSLKPADIRGILTGTGEPVQISGPHEGFDPGLVNAYKALISSAKMVGTDAAHEQAKR